MSRTLLRWAPLLVGASFAFTLGACSGGSANRPPDSGDEAAAVRDAPVIAVTARKWEYSPSSIRLKKGVRVLLEVTSSDVHHGFDIPEFGVRADAFPGRISRLSFTPMKTGTFGFHCDYFCGDGHEEMEGEIVVE
jgi:cytochrome c oxidase subunit 2